jgi:tetratricopeptide (TPR) repeat protein
MENSPKSIIFGDTTTTPPVRIYFLKVVVLLAAVDVVACAQIPAPLPSDRLDSQFLGELNRRQLYDLATDYARDRVRRDTIEESRAFWVDQLATVYRNRTWEESGADRQALTEQSIESITEYLRDHDVAAETNLALRLNQIEGLLNLAQINRLLNTVGYRGPATDIQRSESAGVLPFVERGAELAEALLRQLDTNRGNLDRHRVNMLRERGKRLTLELSVLRYLSTDAATMDGSSQGNQQTALGNQLKSLSRSARLPATPQIIERQLAELQIASGDFDALELTLRQSNYSLSESHRMALEIRSLLRQGKATSALQQCSAVADVASDTGSELSVLRMESLLLLRMLADGLQEVSLLKRSDREFAQSSDLALLWPPSVWRDAAIRVIQRYRLVEAVGAEVAPLIEQVEVLRAAGRLDEALHELQRAFRLLPPRASNQSRAALQLRMGEILVTQHEWQSAIPLLQRAAQLFEDAEQSKPASTAALLIAFSIGQQWRLAPEQDALREKYYAALVEHRRRWPHESTCQQSTAWLVQLTEQIDPLYAAEVLSQEAAEENQVTERLKRMIQLGEQLERCRWLTQESRSSKSWTELVSELQSVSDQDGLTRGDLTDQSARLALLEASLSTHAATAWEVWDPLRQRLPKVAGAITDMDPVTRNRLHRVQLVATARTATDAELLKQQQREFLSGSTGDQLQAALALARYLTSAGSIRPGDSLIAATIDELIEKRISPSSSSAELSKMLELATMTQRVTGNQSITNLLLNQLLKLDLSTEQTVRIAALLMKSAGRQSEQGVAQQADFWLRVRHESKEGGDLWLESCLQLAMIQAQQGKAKVAARQLRVTSVIYPEWGSEQRRRRVDEFLRDL